MDEPDVRIVKLPPMRVASVLGFGPAPETEAWDRLQAWAGPRGYLDHLEEHRVFGFNNPNPSPGSPNYGYELWMIVEDDVEQGSDIEVKEFAGGLYAVTRCVVAGNPYEDIPAAWHRLAQWREVSRYAPGEHQWLEEHVQPQQTPDGPFVLDLYAPLAG